MKYTNRKPDGTDRPKLTVIRGCPGAGKSTYAREHYRCLILENDMFHTRNGRYEFSKNRQNMAVGWCISACETALSNGMDVVVANTFVKRAHIEEYRRIAERNNAVFEVIRCTGEHGSVHDVPEQVLERMRKEFESYPDEKIV